MSYIPTASTTNNSFESLLEEVIAKACMKGAKIHSWYRSPNGRIVIEIYGKLPTFHLSINAAIDTLIHQYNLISQYRYLYQNVSKRFKQDSDDTTGEKISITAKAIYECNSILENMDNDLSAFTRRKLFNAIEKINASEKMTSYEFYHFQNTLLDHFRSRVVESRSTKKKKQVQTFIRYLEEISFSDIE